MALVLKDRVRVTSSTTGTGTFTLGSAAAGFQDFSVIGDGNTTYYTIQNSGDNTWEVGIGTYTASGTTLSRDTVLESSNSGSLVNFAAGTKDVFVTYPAEKGLYLDASNNAIGLGTPASVTLTNATGLPLTTGVTGTLPVANGGTGVTTSTGTGNVVLSTSPTLTTPLLGTPTSGTLTNCTGLPISTGVSGLGTGISTFLGTPSSSNLASAVTDETGSGSLVFATSPTLVTPALGTPSSGTLTSCTGLPLTTGVTGTLPVGNGGTGTATSFTTGSVVFAGASGVYSQDNANLFWDDTNNYLGIGTSSPTTKLQIYNAAGSVLSLQADASNSINNDAYSDTANVVSALNLRRSRGTFASSTAVSSGDNVSQLNFAAYGGSNFRNIASIRGFVDTYTSDTNISGYMSFFTNVGATTPSERIRIDSSGNVGIGTTTPSTYGGATNKFAVVGGNTILASGAKSGTNAVMYLSSTDASNQMQLVVQQNTNASYSFQSVEQGVAYRDLVFQPSGGNVMIGTTATVGGRLSVRAAGDYETGIAIGSNNSANNWARLDFKNTNAASPAILYQDQTGRLSIRTDAAYPITFETNGANERMRIDSSGNVGIGVTPVGTGLLELKAGTATVAPLEFNSGTNLTTPVAGAVEYDGTIITATSNTNFKRGTIPLTNYTSGTGTTLGTNTEATLQALLPAANDTITLSIGTYFIDTSFIITRGASTTSATARLNILGAGTAAGNFSGMSLSAPTSGGTTGAFSFDAVNINVSNVLTAASTTSGGVYQISLRGILKVTTSGTIIPQYNLSANINGAGTVSKVWYFRLQQLDTQSAAAFGPAGTGWA